MELERNELKKNIANFLSYPSARSLALQGPWGVGKTTLWKTCLRERQQFIPAYSYVSLFGLQTLDEVKFSIFANMEYRHEPHPNPFRDMWRDCKGYLAKLSRYIKLGLMPDVAPVVDSLVLSFIREAVVCIDDFERRGKGLSAKDVMGFISYLKEERGCKVAILIADKIEDDEEFNSFHEKVLDERIRFAPSTQVSCDLIFNSEGELHKLLRLCSTQLKINNLRILKRVLDSAVYIWRFLSTSNSSTKLQVIRAIVLYNYAIYANDPLMPDVDTLADSNFSLFTYYSDKERPDWVHVLQEYGYTHTDELDWAIATYVKHGFINEKQFKQVVVEHDQSQLRRESIEALDAFFKSLYASLAQDSDQVLDRLRIVSRAAIDQLGPGDVNNVVSVFRALGKDSEALQYVDDYWERIDSRGSLAERNPRAYAAQLDSYMLESFEKRNPSSPPVTKSPSDLISSIDVFSQTINSDVEALARLTETDWYSVLISCNGQHLRHAIEVAGLTPEIEATARKALERIAKKDDLHKWLVSKLT